MRGFFTKTIGIAALCAAAAVCAHARQSTMLPGTVSNFELPNFDENTGVKEWELFGDKAKYVSDTRIDVEQIKLDIYECRAKAELRATIKSPSASVNPDTKIAESPADLSVVGTDFDMKGKKWRWFGDKRFVEVFSDVDISLKDGGKNGGTTNLKSVYASLSYAGKSNVFVLRDNVSVKNSDTDLVCSYLETVSSKSGKSADKIVASGAVKMLRDNRLAETDRAEIFPASGRAELSGSPKITDIASQAKLSGEKMTLDRNAKSVLAFSGKTARARAEIFHAEDGGKRQRILISSDTIKMSQANGKNLFDFSGNVKISAEDFNAECDKLSASALDAKDEKAKLEYIRGVGNVKFVGENGTATGRQLEIVPEKSQICLMGDSVLENPERGTKLAASAIIFLRDRKRGIAISDASDKNSFVVVRLEESPDIESAANGTNAPARKIPTVVKSRRLNFKLGDKNSEFRFEKDVSIKSSDIDASCQKMDVFTQSDAKRTNSPKKIVATDNVVVVRKDYSAEAEKAVIYPRLKTDAKAADAEKRHRFVELSTDPANPGKRPTITLPPFKNIGMKDSATASKVKPSKTVITSDRQWLDSSDRLDRYYFQGAVKVKGTDMDASCEKIEVKMRPSKRDGKKEISQIAMTENVNIVQELKEVKCGRADIYADEQMIALSDNPVVINREDNSRASGYRIVYNKGSQSVVVEGEADGQQQQAQPEFARPTTPEEDEQARPRPTIKLPVKGKN